MNTERERLLANVPGRAGWQHWGPYLSERQWGTVREDYSAGGTAWDYFPHDHARSRAYRWGEDGIAGISDAEQLVCLSLALWNGRDPILKERLFGLTNAEGNHGEDVKEEYFYLDATPSHSYLKMLYKYCQARIPVCGPRGRERAPRYRDARVRARRHRGIRTEPLLRRVHRVRAGRAGRCADADHRLESRPRRRTPAPHSAAGAAQYLELESRRRQTGAARPWRGRHRHRAGLARREVAVCAGRRGAPVHGKRVEHSEALEHRTGGLFQGRHPRAHRPCAARPREP